MVVELKVSGDAAPCIFCLLARLRRAFYGAGCTLANCLNFGVHLNTTGPQQRLQRSLCLLSQSSIEGRYNHRPASVVLEQQRDQRQ